MAATRGWLDAQGCPLTRIAVFPEGRPAPAKEFDALIDTGFTGFAQLPARLAASIGLTGIGEMEIIYPDDTTEPVPVAWASMRLGSETREGFVFTPDRGEILVGVHFLRLFGKTLIHSVNDGVVVLTDEASVETD
jgi:predicted aspartyl protease